MGIVRSSLAMSAIAIACGGPADAPPDEAAGIGAVTLPDSAPALAAQDIADSTRESVFPAEPRRLPPMEDAEARFERFLSLSLEGAPKDRAEFQALFSDAENCQVYGDGFSSYWVANYRVLSVELSPAEDTVRAVAELLTAAEQVPSASQPTGSVVIQRVARDTLHFRLVPDRAGEHWQLCGNAHDGHELGSYGHPENTEYRVSGTSRATVLALIESLRGARSSP